MGGRGANLNVNTYLGWLHEKRIGSYESIYEDGNIKFIMQKYGTRTSAPIFSNTKNRIYVTINAEGKIVGITQYDSNHKQLFSINEPHSFDKIKEVHMHTGIDSGRQITYWKDMEQKYRDLYTSIKQKYDQFYIIDKVKEFNTKYGR